MTMNNDIKWLGDSWAITAEALESIAAEFYRNGAAAAGVMGSAIDTVDPAANGISIIRVAGSLYRFSYESIRSQVAAAIENSDVRVIVLRINSPGGMVSGCKELSDFLVRAGKVKPIYAYADGTMCSAAYWIGSAAKDIAAPVTANIGSIGVRTLHIDWSRWNEKAGLSFTHLAAGEYKVLGNEDEPLSKKAKDYIQGHLNTLYAIFTDSVSSNRGIEQDGMSEVAEGRIFLADEALEKGLIDRVVSDFESYLDHILSKEKTMDLITFKNDHPDLYAQVLDEGKQQARAESEVSDVEQVAAETDRIVKIAGVMLEPDMASSFETVVRSGADATVAASLKQAFGGQAVQSDNEESASRQRILDGLQNAHSQGVNQERGSEPAGGDFEKTAKSLADLANGRS